MTRFLVRASGNWCFYSVSNYCSSDSFDLGPNRKALSSLSYCHKPGSEPLIHLKVGDVVERTADISGDDTAVVSCHQGIRKSYADFADDVSIRLITLFATPDSR